jgi:PKD repeat protein
MCRNLCHWMVFVMICSQALCTNAFSLQALPDDHATIQEVATAYGESAEKLECGNLTDYDGSAIVNFTVASSTSDGSATYRSGRSMSSIKKEINQKINPGNRAVSDMGRMLLENYSGPRRIEQICSIYDSLVGKDNWTYVEDWKGLETFQFSNQTLELGGRPGRGKGDCDDFSILMAALIESVGGTSRIIFAHGPKGGHAYAEVYLGNRSDPDNYVDNMVKWLRYKYNVKYINTHVNISSDEVWLNLDWWTGSGGSKYPGGPFFSGTDHNIVYENDSFAKAPLTHENIAPKAMISVSPPVPNVGDNITLDANGSFDVDGEIVSYLWEFGDSGREEGRTVLYYSSRSGPLSVKLTVKDDRGAISYNNTIININSPPIAEFTYDPQDPIANVPIRFTAIASLKAGYGIRSYQWDFGDGGKGETAEPIIYHAFNRCGRKIVNLTIVDTNGAKNATSYAIYVAGAEISNLMAGYPVPQPISNEFTLIGNYSPANLSRPIWIFVKQEGPEGRYYPQSINCTKADSAFKLDGRWETRIFVGEQQDVGKFFDIIVAIAYEDADRMIVQKQREWCTQWEGDKGFERLPDGVVETQRVTVVRSDDRLDKAPAISNINLPGSLNITELKYQVNGTIKAALSGEEVDSSMIVLGNCSEDATDQIWILVRPANGRWYPQSNLNSYSEEHVDNVHRSGTLWYADVWFGGSKGEPFDVVAVLANASADRKLDGFQKRCGETPNPDNTSELGDYPGLATIQIPAGIDEKARLTVVRS